MFGCIREGLCWAQDSVQKAIKIYAGHVLVSLSSSVFCNYMARLLPPVQTEIPVVMALGKPEDIIPMDDGPFTAEGIDGSFSLTGKESRGW